MRILSRYLYRKTKFPKIFINKIQNIIIVIKAFSIGLLIGKNRILLLAGDNISLNWDSKLVFLIIKQVVNVHS